MADIHNSGSERAERRVTVTDVADPPADLPFDLSIAVEDPWITPESTATLSATIANTGDRAKMYSQALKKARSEDYGPKGLLLFSTNSPESPPETYAPPCLRGASPTEYERRIAGPHGTALLTTEGGPMFELHPGESRTDTLHVVDDPTADGCFPPGEYRFVERHTRVPITRAEFESLESRSDPGSFEWSFTVVIEAVD